MAQRLLVQRLLVRRISRHTIRTPLLLRRHTTSNNNLRWMHSTSPILKSDDDDNATAGKATDEPVAINTEETNAKQETLDESTKQQQQENENDEIPEWQNPLHHNNPELEKMFPEDFAEGEEMPLVPLPPMAKEGSKIVQAPQHVHDIANEILSLNMLEMKQLVDKVADHFGFDTQAVALGLGGGGGAAASSDDGGQEGGAAEEEAVQEKTTFDLKLTGFDSKSKIKVIKEVRSIAGLGLKEAKEMVEGAPKIVKKDLKKEEAEELQKKLEEVGATIEIV